MKRRTFLRRAGLGGAGAMLGLTACPSPGTPFPTATDPNAGAAGFGRPIRLEQSARAILAEIGRTGEPYYNANGRFYLVAYPTNRPEAKQYVDEGVAAEGLMALFQVCSHHGCRVPFCKSSNWFECPCHGTKYNRAGEYKLGPSARGMDRMKMTIENGVVTVFTSDIVKGPPRGTDTTGQEKEGPFCV